MTEEEKIQRSKAMAELLANPKYKCNYAHCKRWGTKIYAPMPSSYDISARGAFSFVTVLIAYLNSIGWRVVKGGNFERIYVCPRCLSDSDTEFIKPTSAAIKANNLYRQWLKECKEKRGEF